MIPYSLLLLVVCGGVVLFARPQIALLYPTPLKNYYCSPDPSKFQNFIATQYKIFSIKILRSILCMVRNLSMQLFVYDHVNTALKLRYLEEKEKLRLEAEEKKRFQESIFSGMLACFLPGTSKPW